jgi:hypothetical protein
MKKIITAIFLTALLGAGCNQQLFTSNNSETPTVQQGTCEINDEQQSIATNYINALNEKDSTKLKKLIPSDHNTDMEVEEKIGQYGGMNIHDIKYEIFGCDVVPYARRVQVSGRYLNGKEFKDDLYLEQYNRANKGTNEWYLIMGCLEKENGGTGDCVHPNF